MQHNSSFAPQMLNTAPRLLDVGKMLCMGVQRISSRFRIQWVVQAGAQGAAHPWSSGCLTSGLAARGRGWAALLLTLVLLWGRRLGQQPTFLWLCNDRFSWPLGSEGRGAQGVLPALFFLIEHSQHISAENFLETTLSSVIALLLPCHQIAEASRYRSFLDEKQLHVPFGVSYFKKCWPDIICRLWSRNCWVESAKLM